ncbi:MAG TPA: serine/threonine-protein kinase, partial [Longimicrobiales bacterium]|nr:serine/threonine-protein kinase [Longimicrobiales bacterium]
FLAEIEVTANLQHPHILPLYDSGEADGFLFYVMPYVEGESLRDRLDREHQLPVDEAVSIAVGMAEALDYAHRHGIVHRDIKPANVLLLDGKPVLSDFGIALAVGSAGGGRLTETGLSLGTPHYMSPEQATGEASVGPHADIYALGCVLYEMLVGDPPHTGSTAQAVLAKIITEPPPRATRARRSVPPNVEAAVEKALEKLPADRFANARSFANALTEPGFRHGPEEGAAVAPGGGAAVEPWKRRATLLGALAGVLAILAGSLGWALTQGPTPRGGPVTLQIHLPDSALLEEPRMAFVPSPEGERLVMVYEDGLVVRDLTSLDLDLIPLEGARDPFASPGGEWIGFVSGASRRLEKVDPEGGARIPLGGDAPLSFGATWGPEGRIVYAPAVDNGLWLVRDGDGTPEQLTTPDAAAGELGHWRPTFLPDGRTVLFTVYRSPLDSSSIEALDLETRERTWILDGGHHARYVDSGHLVFAYYEALHAVPFDPEGLAVTGPRTPVVSDVVYEQANALAG